MASDYAGVLAQSVFCVGAVMLYYLLYVSGRVPRWLSVWGLIGVPLFLAAGFALAVTGEPNSTFSNIMYAPLFAQEMVLAFWLILRGFNARSLASHRRGQGFGEVAGDTGRSTTRPPVERTPRRARSCVPCKATVANLARSGAARRQWLLSPTVTTAPTVKLISSVK